MTSFVLISSGHPFARFFLQKKCITYIIPELMLHLLNSRKILDTKRNKKQKNIICNKTCEIKLCDLQEKKIKSMILSKCDKFQTTDPGNHHHATSVLWIYLDNVLSKILYVRTEKERDKKKYSHAIYICVVRENLIVMIIFAAYQFSNISSILPLDNLHIDHEN